MKKQLKLTLGVLAHVVTMSACLCQTHTSITDGNWQSPKTWQSKIDPGLIELDTVSINSFVYVEESFHFACARQRLLQVNDTLIVYGDVVFDSLTDYHQVLVNDAGVLIVLGDLILGRHHAAITTLGEGVLAVKGSVIAAGAVDHVGDGLFVGGSASLTYLGDLKTIDQLSDVGYREVEEVVASAGESVLPVDLVRFEAQRQYDIVRLSWETASERDTDRFEVYRSGDHRDLERIAVVPARGNTDRLHSYSFVDAHPLMGANYYFLKMVDYDEQAKSSAVRSCLFSPTSHTIYPNPTPDGTFRMNTPLQGSGYSLTIRDLQGKTVLQQDLKDRQEQLVTGLEYGHYVISLTGPDLQLVDRLIVGN